MRIMRTQSGLSTHRGRTRGRADDQAGLQGSWGGSGRSGSCMGQTGQGLGKGEAAKMAAVN